MKRTGGGEDDPVARVTSTLSGLHDQLGDIKDVLASGQSTRLDQSMRGMTSQLDGIREVLSSGTGTETSKILSVVATELQGLRQIASHAADTAEGEDNTSDTGAWFPLNEVLRAIEKLERPSIASPEIHLALQQLVTVLQQINRGQNSPLEPR
jgi:hypothetical protein